MKENVRITVRGEQSYQGDNTVTQQTLFGSLEQTERGWRITYEEQEENGLGKTRTTLDAEQERVTLIRSGDVRSEMVFSVGERHISDYRTAQGSIALEIKTESLRAKLTERGGILELRYAVSMNGCDCGKNCLKIRVQV